MIQAKVTKNLTGITIQGDYDDFNDLVNAIYWMTGVDSNEAGLYDEVKMRLLGLCYDIRHAYMGDREVVLKDNVLNEDLNFKADKMLAEAAQIEEETFGRVMDAVRP